MTLHTRNVVIRFLIWPGESFSIARRTAVSFRNRVKHISPPIAPLAANCVAGAAKASACTARDEAGKSLCRKSPIFIVRRLSRPDVYIYTCTYRAIRRRVRYPLYARGVVSRFARPPPKKFHVIRLYTDETRAPRAAVDISMENKCRSRGKPLVVAVADGFCGRGKRVASRAKERREIRLKTPTGRTESGGELLYKPRDGPSLSCPRARGFTRGRIDITRRDDTTRGRI